MVPAGDISEQISPAGEEASGTGNMKLALNGAVTVGTLDGANIEIRNLVGADNFFLFGLTANEVIALRERGYDPRAYYSDDAELRATVDALASGAFTGGTATPPGRPSTRFSHGTSTWCWPITGPMSTATTEPLGRPGPTRNDGPGCQS